MKIIAITISGNTLITLKINLLILETGLNLTMFLAAINASGINKMADKNVLITAIANVSNKPLRRSSPSGIYT